MAARQRIQLRISIYTVNKQNTVYNSFIYSSLELCWANRVVKIKYTTFSKLVINNIVKNLLKLCYR